MTLVRLGQICEFLYGKSLPTAIRNDGSFNVYGSNGIVGTHTAHISTSETVIVGRKGSVGAIQYSDEPCWPIDTTYFIDRNSTAEDVKWLFYALQNLRLTELNKATGVPGLNRNDAYARELWLPSPNEQRRIVTILDKANTIRCKRKKAVALSDDFVKSVFLSMFGDPESNPLGLSRTPLGEIIRVSSGSGLTGKNMDPGGTYAVYGGNGVSGYHSEYMFEEPQIIIGRVGVYCGAVHISEPRSWVTDNALYIREYKKRINKTYLEWALRFADLNQYAGRAAQPLISGGRIYEVSILEPSEEKQGEFELIVANHKKLLCRMSSDKELSDNLFASLSQRAFRGEI